MGTCVTNDHKVHTYKDKTYSPTKVETEKKIHSDEHNRHVMTDPTKVSSLREILKTNETQKKKKDL